MIVTNEMQHNNYTCKCLTAFVCRYVDTNEIYVSDRDLIEY